MYRFLIVFVLVLNFSGRMTGSAQEAGAAAPAEVKKALEGLGAETWQERAQARKDLQAWAGEHLDAFVELSVPELKTTDEPEVQKQLQSVLRDVVIEHLFQEPAFLGIRMTQAYVPITVGQKQYHPIEVSQVLDGCAAKENGIQNGDKILQLDDKACKRPGFDMQGFIQYVSAKKPGDTVQLMLMTLENKVVIKNVTLGSRGDLAEDLATETKESRQDAFFQKWLQQQGLDGAASGVVPGR